MAALARDAPFTAVVALVLTAWCVLPLLGGPPVRLATLDPVRVVVLWVAPFAVATVLAWRGARGGRGVVAVMAALAVALQATVLPILIVATLLRLLG
jgi:hypothetical protein